jgi:hypothetical protein
MNLFDVLKQLNIPNLSNISVIVFILLTLVEITPIQINPWSMLARWISKVQGIDSIKTDIEKVSGRIDEVEGKIDDLKISQQDKDELKDALAARHRILRFNDELLSNQKHSKEMFDDILKDITNYDKYCREHPNFKNRKAVLSEENVVRVYQDCLRTHDFL